MLLQAKEQSMALDLLLQRHRCVLCSCILSLEAGVSKLEGSRQASEEGFYDGAGEEPMRSTHSSKVAKSEVFALHKSVVPLEIRIHWGNTLYGS